MGLFGRKLKTRQEWHEESMARLEKERAKKGERLKRVEAKGKIKREIRAINERTARVRRTMVSPIRKQLGKQFVAVGKKTGRTLFDIAERATRPPAKAKPIRVTYKKKKGKKKRHYVTKQEPTPRNIFDGGGGLF